MDLKKAISITSNYSKGIEVDEDLLRKSLPVVVRFAEEYLRNEEKDFPKETKNLIKRIEECFLNGEDFNFMEDDIVKLKKLVSL